MGIGTWMARALRDKIEPSFCDVQIVVLAGQSVVCFEGDSKWSRILRHRDRPGFGDRSYLSRAIRQKIQEVCRALRYGASIATAR